MQTMPASTNNSYAEKWTMEVVQNYLTTIYADVIANNIPFVGRAMNNQMLARHVWTYWRSKYHDEVIKPQMDLIESVCETNLVMAGLQRDYAATMTMFCLRNNHHWTSLPQPEPQELTYCATSIKLRDGSIIKLG